MASYSFKNYDGKTMVRFLSRNVTISRKYAYEISKFIKNMQIDKATEYMEAVLDKEKAIPYTKHNKDKAHRKGKGFGPGGYPVNTAKVYLKFLRSLKSQAQYKGLDTTKLFLIHCAAYKSRVTMKPGRHRAQSKNTTVELIAQEKEIKEKKKKEKKK